MPEKPTRNHNAAPSPYPRGDTGPAKYGYVEEIRAATAELAELAAQLQLEQNDTDPRMVQLREEAAALHEAYYAGENIQSLGAKAKEGVLRGVESMLLDENISDSQLKECLDLGGDVTRYAEAYKPWNMLRLVDKGRLKDGAGDRLLEAAARSAAAKHREERGEGGETGVGRREYMRIILL